MQSILWILEIGQVILAIEDFIDMFGKTDFAKRSPSRELVNQEIQHHQRRQRYCGCFEQISRLPENLAFAYIDKQPE